MRIPKRAASLDPTRLLYDPDEINEGKEIMEMMRADQTLSECKEKIEILSEKKGVPVKKIRQCIFDAKDLILQYIYGSLKGSDFEKVIRGTKFDHYRVTV